MSVVLEDVGAVGFDDERMIEERLRLFAVRIGWRMVSCTRGSAGIMAQASYISLKIILRFPCFRQRSMTWTAQSANSSHFLDGYFAVFSAT